MPALLNQKPWAVFCKFKTEEGVQGCKLMFLKEGQSVDDLLYMVSKHCTEASKRVGVNVWLEDHNVINAPDDEKINYSLGS